MRYSTDAVKVPVLLFTEPNEKTVVGVFRLGFPPVAPALALSLSLLGFFFPGFAFSPSKRREVDDGIRLRGEMGAEELGYGAELDTVGVEKKEY